MFFRARKILWNSHPLVNFLNYFAAGLFVSIFHSFEAGIANAISSL